MLYGSAVQRGGGGGDWVFAVPDPESDQDSGPACCASAAAAFLERLASYRRQGRRGAELEEVALVKADAGPGICCRDSLAVRNADMPITARRSANWELAVK